MPFYREEPAKVAAAPAPPAAPEAPKPVDVATAQEIPAPAAPASEAVAPAPVEAPAAAAPAAEPAAETPAQETAVAAVEVPAATEAAPEPAATPGQIIIQPGNNLWKLSRQIYGKGIMYTVIYEANKDQIRKPELIYPGQVFLTPDAAAATSGQ
jgi:nucleoid-associated protein YgaU